MVSYSRTLAEPAFARIVAAEVTRLTNVEKTRDGRKFRELSLDVTVGNHSLVTSAATISGVFHKSSSCRFRRCNWHTPARDGLKPMRLMAQF